MKKLAVLLPTYNAAAYLNESIDSILNQTFTDFDLYIYDDCSTDHTEKIISKYKDARLFYRKNAENSGIAKTLNKGLEELLPQYEYIGRMDADDWCYPERFQKQIDFLDENIEIIMCGTQGYWLKNMSQDTLNLWRYPTNHNYIKCNLLFSASFGHTSIIFKSHFLISSKLRYDESINTCEDWDLWTRIVMLGSVANLPDFLMKYRVLENSNHRSILNRKKHLEERSLIIAAHWKNFEINITPQQVFEFYYDTKIVSITEFKSKMKILIKIFNAFVNNNLEDLTTKEKGKFCYLLARRVLDYWKRSKVSRFNPNLWFIVVKEVTFMNKFKLLKSIIK